MCDGDVWTWTDDPTHLPSFRDDKGSRARNAAGSEPSIACGDSAGRIMPAKRRHEILPSISARIPGRLISPSPVRDYIPFTRVCSVVPSCRRDHGNRGLPSASLETHLEIKAKNEANRSCGLLLSERARNDTVLRCLRSGTSVHRFLRPFSTAIAPLRGEEVAESIRSLCRRAIAMRTRRSTSHNILEPPM